jgi:Uma2 family endonuclease
MNAPAFFPRTETARHRFTVEDVWRMVEAGVIDEDAKIELLDGEIIDMASEGDVHLDLKSTLVRWLNVNLSEDWRVVPDGTLHLSPQDAPEPDAYVLPKRAVLRPVDPSDVELVVEISDSTLARDLGRKSGKYAQYGLREYWVVDVNARVVHVLTDPVEGAYRETRTAAFSEVLTPLGLPQLHVRFDELSPAQT